MERVRVFISAMLAGVSIALGGTVFLSIDSKILGAIFFTVGLFTVCTLGLHLFTGKVCYIFEQDYPYAAMLPVIWIGNLAGAYLTAQLEYMTRIGPSLRERAVSLCAVKLNDNLLSIFLLAFFCNTLIYLAVDGYKNNPHEIGKYLALFFGVTVFILCGFEHCVANMYYFSAAGAWSVKTIGYLIVMTLGNAAGGVSIPLLRKLTVAK